ncbi:MAG: MotA/TolQ/ExbB proton channel family protein [Alphaproteobacteria bacterium]
MTYALRDLPAARALFADEPATTAPLPAAMLGDDPAAFSYLLLLRFGVVNLVGVALAAGFVLAGWADDIVLSDSTRLTQLIVATFVAGLALSIVKVWRVSQELNEARADNPAPGSRAAAYLRAVAGTESGSRGLIASSLRFKLTARIVVIRQIGSTLVLLGLIGTVIGFIIALSGVNPEAAADASSIGPMVATLIEGMAVALNTTLVGAVLNIWLVVNYQLLATGTINLITAIVARGESRARS